MIGSGTSVGVAKAWLWTVVWSMVWLATVGCEQQFVAEGAVSECSEVATQCRLPEGPLGVCERGPCEVGDSPPCFVCTPQH